MIPKSRKKYDKPGRPDVLTERQRKFCEEYMIDLNGKQAAIRAGYSEKSSALHATALLRMPKVAEELKRLMDARAQRTEVSQDRVLLEIARLAFNDPRKAFDDSGNILPIKEWPDEVAAAVSSIEILETKSGDETLFVQTKKIKFWDKSKNLDLAARHLGMLTDNVNLKGKVTLIFDKHDLDA